MEDELEEKIKENMKRAFCDLVDERNTEYLKKLTEEIADRMCALVPNRRDIHVQIKSDTETVDEHTIPNIVKWLYKLQSPHLGRGGGRVETRKNKRIPIRCPRAHRHHTTRMRKN